ncbi:hypothetical protein [Larkinella soli]|uniref:hypothetical protein n=1 Tax=Larkinella soli TaxID=1770527 RepID=UPI000FFC93C1|nr:hypothetical protein [Larkinella soli]
MAVLIRKTNAQPSEVPLNSPLMTNYGGQNVSMSLLKEKVTNYQTFVSNRSNVPPGEVILAGTIDSDVLQNMLSSNPTINGLRIYLTKENSSDDTHDDVSFLIVPVNRSTTTDPFSDLVSEDGDPSKNAFVFQIDCRSPHCGTTRETAKLLPDNLFP